MKNMVTVMVGGILFLGGCGDAEADGSVNSEVLALQRGEHSSSKGVGGDRDQPGHGRIRCPHNLPTALDPPADAALKNALAAVGVQIYTCAVPAAGGAPAFALKAPHAVLSDGEERTAAIHFAGPTWQALDGSFVTATRLASAPAPDPTAIPWLLLQAATHGGGNGAFAGVTIIQRLDTVGGVAPASGCDAAHLGAEVVVPYTANYFFYEKAAAGSHHLRQCSSSVAR